MMSSKSTIIDEIKRYIRLGKLADIAKIEKDTGRKLDNSERACILRDLDAELTEKAEEMYRKQWDVHQLHEMLRYYRTRAHGQCGKKPAKTNGKYSPSTDWLSERQWQAYRLTGDRSEFFELG